VGGLEKGPLAGVHDQTVLTPIRLLPRSRAQWWPREAMLSLAKSSGIPGSGSVRGPATDQSRFLGRICSDRSRLLIWVVTGIGREES
jgi:hypothetical protein